MANTQRTVLAIAIAVLGCWHGTALADPGGRPACVEQLHICADNLATCTTSRNALTADLATCTAGLNTCEAQYGTCTKDLDSCGTNLSMCTTNLTACGGDLTTCTTSLDTRTAELISCTANLNARIADLSTCTTELNACATNLETCTTDLSTCQTALAAAEHFPASGQATCWDSSGVVIGCAGTGQDGAIKAGTALSYTDNDNGTITDNNTKLVWEKKSADGSIHDANNAYTWSEAFTLHIETLNTNNFGGYSDWRLPNVRELLSIVDYGRFDPSVSPAFYNNCTQGATVLTGSCTALDPVHYWTSTTSASSPNFAWGVVFTDGLSGEFFKVFVRPVRAVRGGA